MKRLLRLGLLFPLSCLAQYPNPLNNPNLPSYQNPTQQRLQIQMQAQQLQQQNMLNQQIQSQRLQQPPLKTETRPAPWPLPSSPDMIKDPTSHSRPEALSHQP